MLANFVKAPDHTQKWHRFCERSQTHLQIVQESAWSLLFLLPASLVLTCAVHKGATSVWWNRPVVWLPETWGGNNICPESPCKFCWFLYFVQPKTAHLVLSLQTSRGPGCNRLCSVVSSSTNKSIYCRGGREFVSHDMKIRSAPGGSLVDNAVQWGGPPPHTNPGAWTVDVTPERRSAFSRAAWQNSLQRNVRTSPHKFYSWSNSPIEMWHFCTL